MQEENYNSKSFEYMKSGTVEGTRVFNLFDPTLIYNYEPVLDAYTVAPGQDGRIDLVLESMYGSIDNTFAHMDVILFINNIDNPLNIRQGQTLLYPAAGDLADFRYDIGLDRIDIASRNGVLGTVPTEVNKSAAVDPNRSNYLNKVSFPPTINQTPQPGVRIEDGKFLIGGIG